MEQKERKLKNGRWKIENGRRKNYQIGEDFFFFPFHFSKRLKIVLGLPKWEFSTGKSISRREKKIRKNDFAPSEKYSSYASALHLLV